MAEVELKPNTWFRMQALELEAIDDWALSLRQAHDGGQLKEGLEKLMKTKIVSQQTLSKKEWISN